ncbi:heterokaryon incompatibility het-6 [Fusarium sp. NRRL 52700]|nr:heterokaryon incompatibility het-6 [Fusarium sp. NRRL 52700]
MPRLQYGPLLPLELRFLELKPGLPNDPLAGTIFHREFSPETDEIPEFEALSYCWGDQSEPVPINIEKDCQSSPVAAEIDQHLEEERSGSAHGTGSLYIGSNLASALRALRLPNEKRILWCDSICIDQQDLAERAAQVQRMGHIYRYAGRVIVWLGPDTSWSLTAIETLRWVASQIKSTTANLNYTRDCFSYTKIADKRFTEGTGPLPLSPAQWLALEQLLALQWYSRLWTYQEIVLANQDTCMVKLGKEEMPWIRFKDAITFVTVARAPPPDSFLDESTFGSNSEMILGKALACQIDLPGKYSWIDVMSLARIYQCSDPRDRVFAVQALVAPHLAQSIKPDYTKSAKEILTSVCLDHITRNRNIDFLTHCNTAASPSWVADLERPLGSFTVHSNPAPRTAAVAHLVEPNVLEVAGVLCDELHCDPIPLSQKRIFQADAEYREAILCTIRTLIGSGVHQDDEEGCLNKLIMMLTYGCVREYSIQKLQPPSAMSLHSLEEWRWKIRRWLSGTVDELENTGNYCLTDRQFISTLPVGSTANGCAKTLGGSFVRVPTESRSGDIIAVLLGSTNSIALRPQSEGGYLVVGACYHPGFSNGQALLGDDFDGWEPMWDTQYWINAFHKQGYPIRRTDPRLDNIPFDDGYVEVLVADGIPGWTQGGSPLDEYDPRMSEAALKKRGIPVQKLRLL